MFNCLKTSNGHLYCTHARGCRLRLSNATHVGNRTPAPTANAAAAIAHRPFGTQAASVGVGETAVAALSDCLQRFQDVCRILSIVTDGHAPSSATLSDNLADLSRCCGQGIVLDT